MGSRRDPDQLGASIRTRPAFLQFACNRGLDVCSGRSQSQRILWGSGRNILHQPSAPACAGKRAHGTAASSARGRVVSGTSLPGACLWMTPRPGYLWMEARWTTEFKTILIRGRKSKINTRTLNKDKCSRRQERGNQLLSCKKWEVTGCAAVPQKGSESFPGDHGLNKSPVRCRCQKDGSRSGSCSEEGRWQEVGRGAAEGPG